MLTALALSACLIAAPSDGAAVKTALKTSQAGANLLRPDRWTKFQQGFQREAEAFVCDNGSDANARRGATQVVVLNQTTPAPIVATAWSKAEGVSGGTDSNYALYLDLTFTDGTPLYGQVASFSPGTHDWQKREVVVLPEKPVRQVSCYLLLRQRAGKALFRQPELRQVDTPSGATVFDGVPVTLASPAQAGFQVRDVAADSDFVSIGKSALGLTLTSTTSRQGDAELFDVELRDTTGRDRAVTLYYVFPVPADKLQWLADPRRSEPVAPRREYCQSVRFNAGSRRLGHYPFAAVAGSGVAAALGIDMSRPAFFRTGYNAATGELFLAYDLGFAKEKPTARLRFCRFGFDPAWGFRAALDAFYRLFPEQFRCRTPEQGLWMPFAAISKVKGWEDFGFKFKEGDGETKWDDAHQITTFRYTEPMTWWMRMEKNMPRTLDAALAEAQRLADVKHDRMAQALLTSGYHNAEGQFVARLLDTPWCNGAVWSMNSMPGIAGDVTDFKNKWNESLREKLYGAGRKADLDGEYIDSSEGYVTDELDFRRDHLAAADTPLTFCPQSHKPAIFRGLVSFEYVRGIARDVHGMGKLMMANGAPGQLCWLMPLLEVGGTETDWHRQGKWRPMSDAELIYRRALCKGKPYCFLMNTVFDEFGDDLVEKYMQRSLAYGMFPGFFSHNASQGQYFTRPELYDRQRPLFKKYVPLCKRVAEAGWEPITQARSDDAQVYVERFGTRYFTVFNDSDQRRQAVVRFEAKAASATELLSGRKLPIERGQITIDLAAESVAVLEVALH